MLKIQKVLKSVPKVRKGHKCTQTNAKIQRGQQDAGPVGEWPVREWPVGEWPVGEWPVGVWPCEQV